MIDTTYVAAKTIQELQSASASVGFKDYLGLIALFSSALVAVLVGQYLQDRKSKNDRIYQNKFNIFASILGLRHSKGLSEQFVIAMNQIPIVFHNNNVVLTKLSAYIATHNDQFADEVTSVKNLNSDLNDLVIEIAKDIGFTNIDNNVMKTFFYPKASELRHNQDLVYNELYLLERFPDLLAARKKNDYHTNS